MNTLPSFLSRREMLRRTSLGFGSFALTGLFSERSRAAEQTGSKPPLPHFAPRVKHVIFAYMSGGVSHVDSFDPKPALKERHGQPMPVPVKPTMFNQNGNIMASPWEARPRGKRHRTRRLFRSRGTGHRASCEALQISISGKCFTRFHCPSSVASRSRGASG